MVQHGQQTAETQYNMEQIVPKMGSNPFRLEAKQCRFRFHSEIASM